MKKVSAFIEYAHVKAVKADFVKGELSVTLGMGLGLDPKTTADLALMGEAEMSVSVTIASHQGALDIEPELPAKEAPGEIHEPEDAADGARNDAADVVEPAGWTLTQLPAAPELRLLAGPVA